MANLGALPEELMTEVLVRLPVKTLLVCTSVSKPWLSLITNPDFIKSHLHYVINNNNHTLLDILDLSPAHSALVYITTCLVETLVDRNGHDLSSCHVLFDGVVMPRVFQRCRVVGTSCCNGIICLMDYYRNVVYLWNPWIRRCKQVCVPVFPELYSSRSCRVVIGFGYDSGLNDYKVFRSLYERNLDSVTLKMQVYSANDDSWREFRGPFWGRNLEDQKFERNDHFIFVNRILYISSMDDQQLIAFDLRKDVFRLVAFPSFVQREWSDVLDFKGYVAMVFESVSGIDLWTLDDNDSGQVSSWTKTFSISPDPRLNMWLSCYMGAGLFYGKKLVDGSVFKYNVLYDCEKKETKYYAVGVDNILATLKYTKTLVSLDGFYQV